MNKFILDKAMVGVKSSAPLREEGGISFEVPNSRLERLSSLSLGQLGATFWREPLLGPSFVPLC